MSIFDLETINTMNNHLSQAEDIRAELCSLAFQLSEAQLYKNYFTPKIALNKNQFGLLRSKVGKILLFIGIEFFFNFNFNFIFKLKENLNLNLNDDQYFKLINLLRNLYK